MKPDDQGPILVTGATGFVGRQVVQALMRKGFKVRPVVRSASKARDLDIDNDEMIVVEDVFAQDVAWWRNNLAGCRAVIHCAWYVEPGKYLDSPLNFCCVEGSLSLADAALDTGISHFIGIGTCFEYRLPNAEIDADAPLGPVTVYAASKLALYLMLKHRFSGGGCTMSWARLFYLFGEGENAARLFPMLERKLSSGEIVTLGSGDRVRDFLDARIAGEMLVRLIETRQSGVANICSGKAMTIRQIACDIADRFGRRDLLRFGQAEIHPQDPLAVVGIPNVR